jgi:hypothetical protein
MRSKLILLVLICFLCLEVASAQEGDKRNLTVAVGSAGYVSFKIATVPADAQKVSADAVETESLLNPLAMIDAGHVIHRVLVDSDGDFVFGYDLFVEPLADARQFKVAVRPLDEKFAQQLREGRASAARSAQAAININTLPRSTETQTIDDGDAFALDLLVNPRTGLKIVDLVKFSFDQSKFRREPERTPPARDFTLANVELAVRDYRLVVNDQMIAGGKPTRGCEGALVWFYVPGKGRFIFSLIPHEGYDFLKIGLIEDNKISFTLEGDRYDWISSTPVVGSGGRWNLWVLLDSSYVPIPEFYPPAQKAGNRSLRQVLTPPPVISRLLEGFFPSLKEEVRTGHQTKSPPPSLVQLPSRVRVSIGAADRMENLWPRN